jgi:hypothetical protein
MEAALPALLDNEIALLFLKIYAAMFLLGPIILRFTFKFKAKVDPQLVARESLPVDVQQFMTRHSAGIEGLGFERVGYIKLGTLAGGTQSFMALFSNSKTQEWADISAVKSAKGLKGYFEFITRCSDDTQVDTNTNSTAPVLSASAGYHVFRFPQITDASRLYRAHQMLVHENIGGSRPELPAKGQEVAELKRRLERYGVRQQQCGYMVFDPAGQQFRLTWKGAFLGAWRSIWPISAIRNLMQQSQSQARLRSLGVSEVRSA